MYICPTECGVSECNHEASTVRKPWTTTSCCAMEKRTNVQHERQWQKCLNLEFCLRNHNSRTKWNEVKKKKRLLTQNLKCVHWRGRQWNNRIRAYILSNDLAEVKTNATRTSVPSAPHSVPALSQQFAVAHTLHTRQYKALKYNAKCYDVQSVHRSHSSRHDWQSQANTFRAIHSVPDKELPQCVFIYCLHNNPVSRSQYVTSNGRFADKQLVNMRNKTVITSIEVLTWKFAAEIDGSRI